MCRSLDTKFLCLLFLVVIAWCSVPSLAAQDARADSSIAAIDASNFRQMVMNSDDAWVLEFFSPRCALLITVYDWARLYGHWIIERGKRRKIKLYTFETQLSHCVVYCLRRL